MSATFAEYMDSTAELRGRRDAMLAMIDEYYESRRHPYRHFADADGIVRIHQRVNCVTGEQVRLDAPAEIHHDDVDWLLDLWLETDRLDYELWRVGVS